ncbi:MAG: hypothetical protein KC535_05175 [Nanoarchaeota archaeon]|nr:hypothetical protein [Nanoarchaeota archaeon]
MVKSYENAYQKKHFLLEATTPEGKREYHVYRVTPQKMRLVYASDDPTSFFKEKRIKEIYTVAMMEMVFKDLFHFELPSTHEYKWPSEREVQKIIEGLPQRTHKTVGLIEAMRGQTLDDIAKGFKK